MSDLYHELAGHQLHHLNGGNRLIVVHPNYISKRFLLADLIAPDHTVYLRLDGRAISRDALQQQMATALEEQTGKTSLEEVENLILDECDRAEADAFDGFVDELAQELIQRERGRIVLISRRTPSFVLRQDEFEYECTFVPVDEDLMLCDYARNTSDPHLLEVHAFGSGRVYLDGREVDTWDGILPRSLFFYLVDRGMTTRDDIFKIFWSNLSTKEATNVFHVTKRKISEVLGIDLTTYWSGFYRISPKIELVYDAMTFARLVQDSAVEPPQKARELLLRAIALYRGEFLRSLDLEWTIQRREALLQTYGEALVALAKMSQDAEEKRRALGLYLRSSLTNPQREDLVFNIMSLYEELGMVEDALASYRRLENELNEQLGVKPAPQLREYASALRARLN